MQVSCKMLAMGGFIGGAAIGSAVYFTTGRVEELPVIFGIIGLVMPIRWVKDR
jgi:hypothetical protein